MPPTLGPRCARRRCRQEVVEEEVEAPEPVDEPLPEELEPLAVEDELLERGLAILGECFDELT